MWICLSWSEFVIGSRNMADRLIPTPSHEGQEAGSRGHSEASLDAASARAKWPLLVRGWGGELVWVSGREPPASYHTHK